MHLIQPASSGPTGSQAYCLPGEVLVSSTTIESHVWHKPGAWFVFAKSWLRPRADPEVAILMPRRREAILNSALSVCHHLDHHLCFSFLPRQTGPGFASSWDLGRVFLFEVVALWQWAFILEQFESFFHFFSLSLALRRYMYLAKKGRILWHLPFGPLTSVLLGCGPSRNWENTVRVVWGLGFSFPLCYMLCPAIDWLWA